MANTSHSRVVFVGNVPYNMTEEQLANVFKSVGQVIGFRLAYDRETSKPRGYGFCEFADHETALSAIRNLNGYEVGGRPLRIDLAESDPSLEGKTTVRGEIIDAGYLGPSDSRTQWRSGGRVNDPDAFLANIPQGLQVPKGSSALDSISQSLASMPPNQLMEVLAQMKAFVITHPEQARTLLIKHPQLSYALFQALLLNKIVDSVILERMLASSRVAATPPPPPMAPQTLPRPTMLPPLQHHAAPAQYPSQMPPFPPQVLQNPSMPPPMPISAPPQAALFSHSQQPLSQLLPGMPTTLPPPSYYRAPGPGPPAQPQTQMPPPATQLPPPQSPIKTAPAAEMTEAQHAMLMQVFSIPQHQIDSLAEAERSAIMQIRNRFAPAALGGTTSL